MQTGNKRAREVDLSDLDLGKLDALDPSKTSGEQKEIFKEDIDFRIHFIEPDGSKHTMEKLEKITVRMFCCLSTEGQEYFRVELTSENDIFFFYAHMYQPLTSVDQESFGVIQEQQKLNCEFHDYPKFCIQLLSDMIKPESGMWPEFTIHHDGSGRLIIMKEISIKIFNVLIVDFSPMPEDHVKQSITYRCSSLTQVRPPQGADQLDGRETLRHLQDTEADQPISTTTN